ncbi:hypothetical protein AVEN_68890-1 [Araneus ventricosus]|uniref:Uncharacterized protein n=1 Tax=Araneus ventricosus TaxID=182803 RepID=A0A4Y2C599_ARAVE|nr:hypothetical protein AVEN_68890-1 [Araneus ventricosus]
MTLALFVRNAFSWLLVCPLEVKRRRVSNENPPDDVIWKGALPASAPFSPIAFSGYLGGPANFLVGKLAGAFQDLTGVSSDSNKGTIGEECGLWTRVFHAKVVTLVEVGLT